MRISSQIQSLKRCEQFDGLSKTEIIKNEPMLFSCGLDAAMELGGELTRKFVLNLAAEFYFSKDLIIDSRVHMLMPGWYPCIPGYHHDDVPRTREDKQPNYDDPNRSKHCMMLVSDNSVCPTEFALGELEFPEVPLGGTYYKVWHPIVEEYLSYGDLVKVSCPFNTMVYFDDRTWHQGIKADRGGWRWFIRASISPLRKLTNELRRQVQVYLENPMEGW